MGRIVNIPGYLPDAALSWYRQAGGSGRIRITGDLVAKYLIRAKYRFVPQAGKWPVLQISDLSISADTCRQLDGQVELGSDKI